MRSLLPPFQSRSARHTVRAISAITGLLAIALQPLPASAAVGDDSTDAILGQPNGFSNTPNNGGLDADSLAAPYFSTFDTAGNLYTADFANHRVLIYINPMATDHVADK